MAQANWQKTMRNVALSERPEERTRYRPWTLEIDFPRHEHIRARNLFEAETKYYNSINDVLGPKLRGFPQQLVELDERHERLFEDLAFLGFNLRKVFYKNPISSELPKALEPHRHFIYQKNDAGNRLVTESFLIMTEDFAKPGPIHPLVRKRMAGEMLRFYKHQAKAMMQTLRNRDGEIELREPGEILESVDTIRKRHLQMPREILDVRWDEKNERTIIRNPYVSSFVVENLNLSEEKRWNMLIFHQAPGAMVRTDTPWLIDIKHSKAQYLTKYLDVRSPNGGGVFFAAKSGAGKH